MGSNHIPCKIRLKCWKIEKKLFCVHVFDVAQNWRFLSVHALLLTLENFNDNCRLTMNTRFCNNFRRLVVMQGQDNVTVMSIWRRASSDVSLCSNSRKWKFLVWTPYPSWNSSCGACVPTLTTTDLITWSGLYALKSGFALVGSNVYVTYLLSNSCTISVSSTFYERRFHVIYHIRPSSPCWRPC